MTFSLTVLDRSGDTKITWDDADPARREEVRKVVAGLKEAGYLFYLVDGTPADEVAAGAGTLIVRPMDAAEMTASPAEPATEPPAEQVVVPATKRRGRPRRDAAPAAERNVVAVRPLAGG